jgi:pimeloyl-ACP methyl ester carboxylesterase
MAQDVLALLDELGLESVALVGHDWGGWIGFLLCLHHPHRIRRFVALGILPPWPSRQPRNLLEVWRMAYQIPLALPHVGRRAVAHGAARHALRIGSDAFSEGEIEVFTDRLKGDRAQDLHSAGWTGPWLVSEFFTYDWGSAVDPGMGTAVLRPVITGVVEPKWPQ